MKLAVIETGGKQYLVSEGQKIEVEKLSLEKGKEVKFEKVLLVADGADVQLGKPYVAKKSVKAELLYERRLDKVIAFKYHNKTRYRNKKGHRQAVAAVKILAI